MTREELEALLDDDFVENPLIEAGDLRWRPAFGAPDGHIVVHVNETSDLGRSVRQRVDWVSQSGRRVATVLPRGPSTLVVESQRFLLERNVEIITVDPLQERG